MTEPHVFDLADARERMTPQPAGQPSIEFAWDDDRITFRDQAALNDYVRGAQAEAVRDLAAKVEALLSEPGYGINTLRSDLRALLADALAGNGAEEPSSVPVSAREGGNGQGHAGEGERGAEGRTEAQEGCEHQWMTRGHFGDEWRECFLCGKQEDV